MEPAIRVENLGKLYRVTGGGERANYATLRESVMHAAGAPLRWARKGFAPPDPAEDFWALNDVNFEVQPGEVVGIIGRNGAGKSTLLKILSRITKPTTGRVTLNGRVGSLLEVGTGFHPELTGRENVYLNGSILGMTRREIAKKFDEIVAFAEVERFLDTPVKRYSSGMYVRLAFAVAAHLEPEILIVDEVLAVGDAEFQKKCMGRIGEVALGGRTVLFVSHNIQAVQTICTKAIHMSAGEVRFLGDTKAGIAHYLKDGAAQEKFDRFWPDNDRNAPVCEEVRLSRARIVLSDELSTAQLTTANSFLIEFEYQVLSHSLLLNLSIAIYNDQETCVFSSPSVSDVNWFRKSFTVGRYRTTCAIPGDLLNNGIYRVQVMFVKNMAVSMLNVDSVLGFEVTDAGKGRGDWYGEWVGVVRPVLTWNTISLEPHR